MYCLLRGRDQTRGYISALDAIALSPEQHLRSPVVLLEVFPSTVNYFIDAFSTVKTRQLLTSHPNR